MNWFRFHHDWVNDSKVLALPDRLQLFYVKILCVSSKETDRGSLPNVEVIAKATATTKGKTEAMVGELITAGFIDEDASTKALRVHGWEKRQYQSDDVTARTKRHKERSGNVPRNDIGTSSEADTDSETELKLAAAPARESDPTEPEYPDPNLSPHWIQPGPHEIDEPASRRLFSMLWRTWKDKRVCIGFFEHQRWFTPEVWRVAIAEMTKRANPPRAIRPIELIAGDFQAKGIPVESAPAANPSPRVYPPKAQSYAERLSADYEGTKNADYSFLDKKKRA